MEGGVVGRVTVLGHAEAASALVPVTGQEGRALQGVVVRGWAWDWP